MGRKKKQSEENLVPIEKVNEIQKDLKQELMTNPQFSLEVDPENKYGMNPGQKTFIENYIQFKSIPTAAELSCLDLDTAKSYFLSYNTQQEIRRINRALYQRQFSAKLLDLDQIGGYLTSMLTDENVPLANQLKPADKLKVVDTMIDIIKLKQEAMNDPSKVMNNDLEFDIKNLSVATIQQLLSTSDKEKANKKELVEKLNTGLTVEELEYLETLPTKDLLSMIENLNK